MDPYRTFLASPRTQAPTLEGDGELWMLWMMFAVGAIRVVPACFSPKAWDAEPTVGLLLMLVTGRRLIRRYFEVLRRAWAGQGPAGRAKDQ